MGKITVACVRSGTAYGVEYVERLRNMVMRHKGTWEVDFVCLTDQPEEIEGWRMVNCSPLEYGMREKWWLKMALFNPKFRGPGHCVYFDLDTVIVGDLGPLFIVAEKEYFSVCANFTKAVSDGYPCNYGSCVMTLRDGWGIGLWKTWYDHWRAMRQDAGNYGDQLAIERVYPRATLLQGELPPGYFVGRREFNEMLPVGASVMVFAGNTKPHNTNLPWVLENWK